MARHFVWLKHGKSVVNAPATQSSKALIQEESKPQEGKSGDKIFMRSATIRHKAMVSDGQKDISFNILTSVNFAFYTSGKEADATVFTDPAKAYEECTEEEWKKWADGAAYTLVSIDM